MYQAFKEVSVTDVVVGTYTVRLVGAVCVMSRLDTEFRMAVALAPVRVVGSLVKVDCP